ncbi:MAG: hypothetical protein ABI567_01495 [Gammaproteobacteria bacterium]
MDSVYSVEQVEPGKVRFVVAPASRPLRAISRLIPRAARIGLPQERCFVVSPAGIEIPGGDLIPSTVIHRVVLRNAEAKVRPVTPGSDPAELEAADRSISRGARKAWMLWVEAGRRSTTIVAGMNHATAFAVLSEVCRILGTPID